MANEHIEYGMLSYNRLEVTIKGQGTYETCVGHLNDVMRMYEGKSVQELQDILIWISEGEHHDILDIVHYRAIRSRYHLLVMIASLSALVPMADYEVEKRRCPSSQEVMSYIERIILYQADQL